MSLMAAMATPTTRARRESQRDGTWGLETLRRIYKKMRLRADEKYFRGDAELCVILKWFCGYLLEDFGMSVCLRFCFTPYLYRPWQ